MSPDGGETPEAPLRTDNVARQPDNRVGGVARYHLEAISANTGIDFPEIAEAVDACDNGPSRHERLKALETVLIQASTANSRLVERAAKLCGDEDAAMLLQSLVARAANNALGNLHPSDYLDPHVQTLIVGVGDQLDGPMPRVLAAKCLANIINAELVGPQEETKVEDPVAAPSSFGSRYSPRPTSPLGSGSPTTETPLTPWRSSFRDTSLYSLAKLALGSLDGSGEHQPIDTTSHSPNIPISNSLVPNAIEPTKAAPSVAERTEAFFRATDSNVKPTKAAPSLIDRLVLLANDQPAQISTTMAPVARAVFETHDLAVDQQLGYNFAHGSFNAVVRAFISATLPNLNPTSDTSKQHAPSELEIQAWCATCKLRPTDLAALFPDLLQDNTDSSSASIKIYQHL